jgi:ribosomal-protein-alanine N-acetyltransferase
MRVKLQEVVAEDGPELIQSNLHSQGLHKPWSSPFIDEAGFQQWLEVAGGANHAGLVARLIETEEVVGVVNISQIVMGAFQSGYLGYYGSVQSAGRGLMTEAVHAAAHFAFATLGLHRLEANIQPGNVRSIDLVRRLGFRKEGFSPKYLKIDGQWRDHERWAILADEMRGEVR